MIELDFKDLNVEEVRENLSKNGLYVVRNADISMKEFEEVAHALGKPLVTNKHVINESRTIQELSNKGLFARMDVDWHNDWSYGRGNYHGSILRNVKNAELSPTWFIDMTTVSQEMMDKYKDEIGNYYPPQHLHGLCFTEKQLELLKKQHVTRPFVFEHYVTGEEVLYCSPGTIQDCDLDLSDVVDWAEENAYKHEWQENDMLIWDNIKMMHKRVAFEGERLLWRTQFVI